MSLTTKIACDITLSHMCMHTIPRCFCISPLPFLNWQHLADVAFFNAFQPVAAVSKSVVSCLNSLIQELAGVCRTLAIKY